MRSSSVLYRSIRTRHLGVVSTCSATCRGSVGRCEPPAAVRAGLVESRRAPPTAASATASADFQRRFLSSPTPSGTSSSNSDGSSPLQKKAGDGGSDDSISSSSSSSSSEVQVQEYLPVDFGTSAKIDGEESHVVTIELKPGECVRAESGSMIFMTESIQMNTTLGAGASSAFKRMLTGQNVFLTDFTCQPTKTSETSGTPGEESGTLCLGTDFPSKILRLNLQDMANGTLICQRGAYLASNPTVDIEMEFTKSLSAGFFGGQGFVLQRLSGEGDVLVKAGGTLVAKDLQPNETLRVTSGSIVAFENTIDYDIQMMPGIKNAMFGGEGLFVTKLTGPGRVWLQGLPPDRMISEIARRVPGPGIGLGIPIGMGGGGGAEGEAAEGGADAVGDEGVSEQVAATDSAIDADRQATVASSGMSDATADPDSPASLFGDAAPPGAEKASSAAGGDDASFTTDSTEPAFNMEDDETSFGSSEDPVLEEPNFDDEDFAQQDGEFFGEDPSSSSADFGSDATSSEEGGSGLLGTLWDLFMGGDD